MRLKVTKIGEGTLSPDVTGIYEQIADQNGHPAWSDGVHSIASSNGSTYWITDDPTISGSTYLFAETPTDADDPPLGTFAATFNAEGSVEVTVYVEPESRLPTRNPAVRIRQMRRGRRSGGR